MFSYGIIFCKTWCIFCGFLMDSMLRKWSVKFKFKIWMYYVGTTIKNANCCKISLHKSSVGDNNATYMQQSGHVWPASSYITF